MYIKKILLGMGLILGYVSLPTLALADDIDDGELAESKITLSYGHVALSGKKHKLFDAIGAAVSIGYLYPFQQISDDESNFIAEVNFTILSPSEGDTIPNQLCVFPDGVQSCVMTNSTKFNAFNASIAYFINASETVKLLVKFGAGYYNTTFTQKAIGDRETVVIEETVSKVVTMLGIGVIFSNTVRIEYLRHAPFSYVDDEIANIEDIETKFEGNYVVNEVRLSYMF